MEREMRKYTFLSALALVVSLAALPGRTSADPEGKGFLSVDEAAPPAAATALGHGPFMGRADAARTASAGQVKFYVKIKPKNFSCVWGGYLKVQLKKKWGNQITGPGTHLVGTVPAGRRVRFYAVDAAGQNFWGPWKFYMHPDWTWFVLPLNCKPA